jgi:hypothetical protein
LAGLCGAGIDAGDRDIDLFGDASPGVIAPARRVRDGVIKTVFQPADDHGAAAPSTALTGACGRIVALQALTMSFWSRGL